MGTWVPLTFYIEESQNFGKFSPFTDLRKIKKNICIVLLRYFIHNDDRAEFEKLTKRLCKKIKCSFYLRHKTLLIPPSVLKKNKIRFARVGYFSKKLFKLLFHFIFSFFNIFLHFFKKFIQRPGQFIITLPGAYHSGFNFGINEAEAINFGCDTWLEHFPKFKTCNCK